MDVDSFSFGIPLAAPFNEFEEYVDLLAGLLLDSRVSSSQAVAHLATPEGEERWKLGAVRSGSG